MNIAGDCSDLGFSLRLWVKPLFCITFYVIIQFALHNSYKFFAHLIHKKKRLVVLNLWILMRR